MRIIWTKSALADMDSIYFYYCLIESKNKYSKLLLEIDKNVENAMLFPMIGRATNFLKYRQIIFLKGEYSIYYKISKGKTIEENSIIVHGIKSNLMKENSFKLDYS